MPKCGGRWRWSPAPTDQKAQRAIVVTTDPLQLPAVTTWYLLTNLPAPGSARAATSPLAPASLAEVVGLYGLRMWVEQSYKQVKHALGWAEYQVRSDVAMRRHWVLVWCAFSFCWWQLGHGAAEAPAWVDAPGAAPRPDGLPNDAAGREKKPGRRGAAAPAGVLAGRVTAGAGVAGAVDHAQAVLARVVAAAPATGAPGAARLGAARLCRSISMSRSDRSQQSTVSPAGARRRQATAQVFGPDPLGHRCAGGARVVSAPGPWHAVDGRHRGWARASGVTVAFVETFIESELSVPFYTERMHYRPQTLRFRKMLT